MIDETNSEKLVKVKGRQSLLGSDDARCHCK